MGRPRVGQETQEFRALSERARGKRRRIRLEFIPELAAWLVMVGRRYTVARVKLEQEFHRTSDEGVQWAIMQMKAREEAIQCLCNVISDEFGVAAWEEATTKIAEQYGIKLREDVPPTLRTDAGQQLADLAPPVSPPAKG